MQAVVGVWNPVVDDMRSSCRLVVVRIIDKDMSSTIESGRGDGLILIATTTCTTTGGATFR